MYPGANADYTALKDIFAGYNEVCAARWPVAMPRTRRQAALLKATGCWMPAPRPGLTVTPNSWIDRRQRIQSGQRLHLETLPLLFVGKCRLDRRW